MTKQSIAGYNSEFAYVLRLKDVPGKFIGDALAQVESHVADSGESPVDAFGTPKEFARQLARGRKRKMQIWPIVMISTVLTISCGLLILQAVFGLIQNRSILWGIPPVAGLVPGGLAIIAWILTLAFHSDPIRDPRRRD